MNIGEQNDLVDVVFVFLQRFRQEGHFGVSQPLPRFAQAHDFKSQTIDLNWTLKSAQSAIFLAGHWHDQQVWNLVAIVLWHIEDPFF